MSTPPFSRNSSEVETMPDNSTSLIDLNQTNSTNTLAIIPVSGLTYTLFGLTCLFTCLGLVGNFSILTISLKYRRRAKSHDVLITALAVTDSFATVTFALMQPCVYGTLGMDVRALTTIGCKVFMSVLLSAIFCSSTVVVLVSIERFIAVWYPIRSRNFLSRQTALRSVWLCAAPIVIISTTLSILYCEMIQMVYVIQTILDMSTVACLRECLTPLFTK